MQTQGDVGNDQNRIIDEQTDMKRASPNSVTRGQLKRRAVKRARSGLQLITRVNPAQLKAKGRDYFLSQNMQFGRGVVALWALGYWTDQIAKFIGDDISERLVLQTIRQYLNRTQQDLMAALAGDLLAIFEQPPRDMVMRVTKISTTQE